MGLGKKFKILSVTIVVPAHTEYYDLPSSSSSLNPESVIRFTIGRGQSTKFRHNENTLCMRQTQFLVSSLSRFPLNCSFGKCYRENVIKLYWFCI